MFVLNVLVISLAIGAFIFVFVEVPWMNTEKWFFSMILGGGENNKRKNA